MKLFRVIIPVSDIETATAFYGAVLNDPGRRVSGGRHYFGSPEDGSILACYDPVADGDEIADGWRFHPSQYIYLSTDDLERARDVCITAGAKSVTPIESMPWGETLFYALDPFENPIAFVEAGTEFSG